MEVLKIISNIGLALLSINVILYLIGFIRNDKAYKSLSVYLISICYIQVVMEIMALHEHNNHFLTFYYLFFQFVCLSSFFYYLLLPISKKKSNAVKYISIVVTLGLIVQYCVDPGLYYIFNSLGFLITSLALVTYAVLYLFELLTQQGLPFKFVTIGTFIYLISSSLIFASATSIVTLKSEMYMHVWKINAVLFIIYQLLIFWEWKQRFLPKKTK